MLKKYIKPISIISSILILLLVYLLINGLNSTEGKLIDQWKSKAKSGNFNISYPVDKTIFPPDIASPTVMWEDPSFSCDTWLAFVESNGSVLVKSKLLNEKKWSPDSSDWEKIKSNSIEKQVRLVVLGSKKVDAGKLIASAEAIISTSKDSVAAPIFFRTVTLPFKYAINNLETISWRLGNISSKHFAAPSLEKMPVCANCHSFSKDGKTIGMDVDYANDKGSYVLTDFKSKTDINVENIITWSDYKREDNRPTYGLLSSVSPDGRYCASTVKDRSIFVALDNLEISQLFFPIRGIVAIYDRKEKRYYSLKGADNPDYVQSNPIWSPDGKYILFCKTKAYSNPEAEKSRKVILPTSVAKEFIDGTHRFYYDIMKIPFNNGEGGVAEPLLGASGNDMSNFFPKYTPDGKWIVFTQARNFMLLQPDSKLYIMPSNGGTPRLMNCNTNRMNSWHSFSPNGKWMAFSSKLRGPYTKIYLTHIDENGNDSPPVCLEYLHPDTLAANIPEFVNVNPNTKLTLTDDFINSTYYTESRIAGKTKIGDFKGALAELNIAIKNDPLSDKLFLSRAIIERRFADNKNALIDLNKCIELNPKSEKAYYERGIINLSNEEYKGALSDFTISYKLDERNLTTRFQIGVAKYYLKDYQGSIEDCNFVINVKPDAADVYFQRGLNKLQLGQKDAACIDLNRASQLGSRSAMQAVSDYCR
ncbi:MAG: hypothetical protein NT007_00735 [Candidatus Kapabacteria bacterium]|nr:hypothetical protein [Candidatus Kapabacteria bacterium]